MTTYFPTMKRASISLKEKLIGELILCEDKRRYTSKDDALKSISSMMNESLGGTVDLRPYKCKKCKGYHLTSNIK